MSKVKNFKPILNQAETRKADKMVIDLIPNWYGFRFIKKIK